MQSAFGKTEELYDHLKEYFHNHISLFKLKAAAKSSRAITLLAAAGLIMGILLFFLMFVGIAAALLLSKWLGDAYLGFLIMSGFYLLMSIVIWKYRDVLIQQPILNRLLKEMFSDEDDKEFT